jgi:hypothetical protein
MQLNNYLVFKKKMKRLIWSFLTKTEARSPLKTQVYMLLGHILKADLLIYIKIHRLTMSSGKIWEIVLLNYSDFERVETLDFIFHQRKIIIELKNKSTTLNIAAYAGTLLGMKSLRTKYPDYTFILGFVNSPKIDVIKHTGDLSYRVLGGEPLFRFIFLDNFQDIQFHVIFVVGLFNKSPPL